MKFHYLNKPVSKTGVEKNKKIWTDKESCSGKRFAISAKQDLAWTELTLYKNLSVKQKKSYNSSSIFCIHCVFHCVCKQGLVKTAKSNFGGGNTHWEEKNLGSYDFR